MSPLRATAASQQMSATEAVESSTGMLPRAVRHERALGREMQMPGTAHARRS